MYTVPLSDDPVLRAHLAQLSQAASPIYELIAAIPDLEAQREAGQLADLIVSEQLPSPRSLPANPAELRALRLSVENARPDRRAMHFLLDSFERWLDALSPAARAEFLETFPKLAPAAHDLGEAGMRLMLEAVNLEPKLLGCAAAYAMTTAEAIRAAAALVHRAASHHCGGLVDKLVATFPAERMEESRDAEKLLPALAGAAQAAGDAFAPALELALALVARDVSSARGALRSLPGALRGVPAGSEGFYLDDFRLLIEHIGIGVNGVCLTDLPRWYASFGAERTRAFVSRACQAAHAFGRIAGQYFLERKTPAARDMLS